MNVLPSGIISQKFNSLFFSLSVAAKFISARRQRKGRRSHSMMMTTAMRREQLACTSTGHSRVDISDIREDKRFSWFSYLSNLWSFSVG